MSETMIKVEHITKEYRLGAIGGTTLREDLQRLGAKLKGKEDPTLKIGADQGKYNEKFLALDDVSFEVKKGEALGIIGHNGAGKSTLLKLLSRVTAPTKGTISFNGRIASMLEVGTGFHPELTGRENVYMNGAILGMTKAEIDRKFDEIVAFAEMEKFIDTPVKRYSSGMYVKLAFAVAAHLDSEIMVMDEVLAVGDMKFQQKCLGKMGDAANNEGRTVLYVSHNMNTIRQLCTRCIVLDHGRVIFDGDVEEAISIYMNASKVTDGTEIDLSDMRMDHLPANVKIKMTHLSILDRSQPVYSNKEKIVFSLTLHSNIDIRELRFRFELRYMDGSSVGMAQCDILGEVFQDETKTYTMEFDTSMLIRGKYNVLFCIYEMNEFGAYDDFDAILPALTFEIEDDHMINWNTNAWGHVLLPQLKVTNVSNN